MSQRFVLYDNANSPFGQRVRIALREANVEYTSFEVDTANKPAWFVEKINPIGKVPAILYGGPDVPPDQPSPDSVKLAESHIIAEFIADLYPDSGLMPRDPVQRAHVHRFVDIVNTKFTPEIIPWFVTGASWQGIVDALVALQDLLPDDAAFAVGGSLTLADVAFVPLYSMFWIMCEKGLCLAEAARPRDVAEIVNGPELAKLKAYVDGLLVRPSIKAAVDQERQEKYLRKFVAGAHRHD
ncbi:thioredoxin-like protein [Coniophora puteana RWD-64-598 SS2]|uniref:Thioredoxin-like protein n=1 Tax=Coniophora puteana (strain RWD-64-598) TaxID=741705 RepID=A0A5M3M8M7_CONPW|nr:thioredoxin-like protein [Coniophora puteana RWD-64-598 SS2]EIW75407.1 thioredoxin-like protein [Coniophora puteana RWD-64-598 SS2]